MPDQSEQIPCNYVGTFKVGDNLVYNAGTLCKLVELNKGSAFNKQIVIQVGSILEASLSEIIFRAKHYNREGVPNISEAEQAEIAGKKIDKLNTIIDVMKKYKMLDGLGADIYGELHKLRKYRNKVHIQDSIGIEGVSADEVSAFSDETCTWALKLNVRVLKHLSEHFPRPVELHRYLSPLVVPSPQ